MFHNVSIETFMCFNRNIVKKQKQMINFDSIEKVECLALLNTCIAFFDSMTIYKVDTKQNVLLWEGQMAEFSGISSQQAIGHRCLDELLIDEFSEAKEKTIFLPRKEGKSMELIRYTQVLHNEKGDFVGAIGLLKEKQEQASVEPPFAQAHLNFHGILSRAPKMEPVFQLIKNAATTEVTVLVRGESGSGKELVAKAIHDISTRNNKPFLAVNCAALSSNLLESELFGHVRGAFTGAIKDHNGLFKRADSGTLFLDEVAELPLELQAKLLRVLQEKSFIPVGGDHAFNVDVRIVAATHRSLREEVKKGRFREDLMYRLRVVPIFIPPLRERREDINLLLWHFISLHSDNAIRHIDKIDPKAMRVLMDYHWPGNIRELQNVVEYAFVVGQGNTMNLADLPPEFRESKPQIQQIQAKPVISADEEVDLIRQAFKQSHGKVNLAAELLGFSRATFWRKRKFYDI